MTLLGCGESKYAPCTQFQKIFRLAEVSSRKLSGAVSHQNPCWLCDKVSPPTPLSPGHLGEQVGCRAQGHCWHRVGESLSSGEKETVSLAPPGNFTALFLDCRLLSPFAIFKVCTCHLCCQYFPQIGFKLNSLFIFILSIDICEVAGSMC